MKQVNLDHKNGTCPILIGSGILSDIGALLRRHLRGKKVLIVTNRQVGRYYLKTVSRSFKKAGFSVYDYKLPYGNERDKSKEVLGRLWEAMAEIPLERDSAVVALGGGVVGDLAGFAASTYMRGIAVVQVPTTLLAQVDSSIGGKTAIDLTQAKNIVGAFHQPVAVVADIRTLKTLAKTKPGVREICNSFAEVIKYGVLEDTRLFEFLEKRIEDFYGRLKARRLTAKDFTFLEDIVWRCANVKAEIVEIDEHEKSGRRAILNLGHTFAHGFEAVSGYRLPHGRAVAAGMACAARMAVQMKRLPIALEVRLLWLLRALGLPIRISELGGRLSARRILQAMQRDKKKQAGKLRFVLPHDIGHVVVENDVPVSLIQSVLRETGATV